LRADTLVAKVPENYEKPKQLDWYDSNRKSWSGAERGGTAVCPATNGSHDLQGESEFGERSAERDGEDLILQLQSHLFVFGFVEYKDIFNERHKSGFAYRCIIPSTRFPEGMFETCDSPEY
jgi:hypothetical protein